MDVILHCGSRCGLRRKYSGRDISPDALCPGVDFDMPGFKADPLEVTLGVAN